MVAGNSRHERRQVLESLPPSVVEDLLMRRQYRKIAIKLGRHQGLLDLRRYDLLFEVAVGAESVANLFGLKSTENRKFVSVYVFEWMKASGMWRFLNAVDLHERLVYSRDAQGPALLAPRFRNSPTNTLIDPSISTQSGLRKPGFWETASTDSPTIPYIIQ
jgi:hypothetical protein